MWCLLPALPPWEIYDKPEEAPYGIKWDVGFDGGETKTFEVTLEGQWTIDDVAWRIKAGQDISTGQVEGPTCTPYTSSESQGFLASAMEALQNLVTSVVTFVQSLFQ